MTFTDAEREAFRQAAGVILPPWRHMPDAAGLGLEHRELDRAAAERPALAEAVAGILAALGTTIDAARIAALQAAAPDEFLRLRLLVCGAYYLHPDVLRALDYPGQQATGLPRGGFGAEELVLKLMEGPKRYREVP